MHFQGEEEELTIEGAACRSLEAHGGDQHPREKLFRHRVDIAGASTGLQDGPPWTWPVIAHGLRGVAGIGLRYEGQADARGRRGLRGKAHARICNA